MEAEKGYLYKSMSQVPGGVCFVHFSASNWFLTQVKYREVNPLAQGYSWTTNKPRCPGLLAQCSFHSEQPARHRDFFPSELKTVWVWDFCGLRLDKTVADNEWFECLKKSIREWPKLITQLLQDITAVLIRSALPFHSLRRQFAQTSLQYTLPSFFRWLCNKGVPCRSAP